MTANLFTVGVLIVAAALAGVAWRYLPRRMAAVALSALAAWLLYAGTLSALGIVGNVSLRPPGIAYIAVPILLFMVGFAVRSKTALSVATAVPLPLLMGAQAFRIGVELGLHRLGAEGLVPTLMTFSGGNVDIFIGLTAPLAAWIATRGVAGRRFAFTWNVVGLVSLANIVLRSVLTSPGPLQLLHTEVPNLAIGTFPYTFIAAFFAPLAVLLHVLSLRALRAGAASRQERLRAAIA